MSKKKINQSKVIELITSNKFNSKYQVFFKKMSIDALDATLLSRNGLDLPEDLICYDDKKIDYRDRPPITDEDLKQEKSNGLSALKSHLNTK